MERDERVCPCCGEPSGDYGFCESCRSRLDSLAGDDTLTTGAHATGSDDLAAQALDVLQCEQTLAAEGAVGDGERRGGGPSPCAVQLDPNAYPGERVIAGAAPPESGTDKVSTTGGPLANDPRREVARFEEVLTPASAEVSELTAYQRADAAGDPQGSTNLGVLLEQQGDLEGALAAYARADERGDVNGSFNLGCLLAEVGDLAGAEAALGRADERGDAAGASNLGVLLERRGDLDGALAAYQRADERGDANGAFNLGLLLAAAGDLAGARSAYQRAAHRNDPEVQERAHSALQELEAKLPSGEVEAALTDEEGLSEPEDVQAHDLQESQASEPPSPLESSSSLESADHDAVSTVTEPDVLDAEIAQPRASAGATDARSSRSWGQMSRRNWVVASCLLGLIALVFVLARRRRRSYS